MQIFLALQGQPQGPFDLETVRARLAQGSLRPSDLYWYEGAPNWMPLANLPALAGSGTLPPGEAPPVLPPGAAPYAPLYPVQALPPQTSGLAIASMILGILAFVVMGLTALPAVICGHLSLGRIKCAGGAIGGQGFAIAGLVTGYVGLLFFGLFVLGIIAGIALPVFNSVQQKGASLKSLTQAREIARACKHYARDHDGNFPAQLDELVPTYLPDKHLFVCPIGPNPKKGYDYFGGRDDGSPTTVLFSSQATDAARRHVVVYDTGEALLVHE